MILDLAQFIGKSRPVWQALEQALDRFDQAPNLTLTIAELKHVHYLYERTSSDLVRISTFSADPDTRQYLESLIARAYSRIHAAHQPVQRRFSANRALNRFAHTVKKHGKALILAVIVFFAGCVFGGIAILIHTQAKAVIMPWSHLRGDPSDRVEKEETQTNDALEEGKISFSAQLMTHNTKVAIFSMASGMTCGVVTLILAFYNGVILGAVSVDYIRAGESVFLLAWLLPHGAIEIPAILIAMQAGLVLAGTLIGTPQGTQTLGQRLKERRHDIVVLIAGVACLLIWAGLVEALFSQYHAPILPYWVKILFGSGQLAALILFFYLYGRTQGETP